jgi:hypothetical protein
MRRDFLSKKFTPRLEGSVGPFASLIFLGKFHLFASLMMIFGFGSGQYITQLLGYLEIPNKFLCSTDPMNFSNPYVCEPRHNEKTKNPWFCD